MATCGEYEIERAIGWGRRSTFYSARAATDRGAALIVIRRGRTVEKGPRHDFLRAAAEQQVAVAAGCRRLAPILAFDCDETGFAFYATTRYETSFAEFLEAECKADGTVLRDTVAQVLGALMELHEKSRRAHGNLTPGNILLDPQGHIFLTDLAPSAKDATVADDLYALGKLIYQLVRRTTRIGTLNPPLDYSPAWTEALGDGAEGWLAFTNHLLDKPRNAAPASIKLALADLNNLKRVANVAAKAAAASPLLSSPGGGPPVVRRVPPKKKSPLRAILAALLVLGGGGGGYVYWKTIEGKNQPPPPPPPGLPNSLINLREELKKPLPREIDPKGPLNSLLRRIAQNFDGKMSAEGILTEADSLIKNWTLPKKMAEQAGEWQSEPRAWNRLASELQEASEVSARGDVPIIEQLQKALIAQSAATDLSIQWEEITRVLGVLDAAGNALLPKFGPWAENEIRNARDIQGAGEQAKKTLEALIEVRNFQRDMGARVVWARFEKEAPEVMQKPSDELLPTWPMDWKEKAAKYVAPTDEKQAEWKRILKKAEDGIPFLLPKDRKQWQDLLEASRTAIRDAMESDAAKIDRDLVEFGKMRPAIELAQEEYVKFLQEWKPKVAALDKDDKAAKGNAGFLIAEFEKRTGKILADFSEFKAKLDSNALASKMKVFLLLPEKISLNFSNPAWKQVSSPNYDAANAAYYQYLNGGKAVAEMHFLKLDEKYAMAAWETPLMVARQAKLAGLSVASIPRDGNGAPTNGPQTRTDDFSPLATDPNQWLWKGPRDLLQTAAISGKGPKDYFGGVIPGDSSFYAPATWLTFEEAGEMATVLGGRLPTAAEWKLAARNPGRERRLRSRSAWGKIFPQLKIWQDDMKGPPLSASAPDIGSFSKSERINDKEPAPNATEDGKLWLAAAGTRDWKPTDQFSHLIGNAAEWVNDNGVPGVMGGSVVSPPTLPPDEIVHPRRGAAFFDVTFRLVVPLGPGGAGVGVQSLQEFVAALVAPPVSAAR